MNDWKKSVIALHLTRCLKNWQKKLVGQCEAGRWVVCLYFNEEKTLPNLLSSLYFSDSLLFICYQLASDTVVRRILVKHEHGNPFRMKSKNGIPGSWLTPEKSAKTNCRTISPKQLLMTDSLSSFFFLPFLRCETPINLSRSQNQSSSD